MGFDFKKLKVLLVEDTVPMRKLVTSVFDTLGVGRIYSAEDGEGGFMMFCNKAPDIVIADWHMVPMNGLEMVKKIRRDPDSPNPTVPVVMMTGYSAYPRVAEARDAGVTEFLVKPFSATDMARRIAYVINHPRDFISTDTFFGPDRRRVNDQSYTGPERRKGDLTYI